MRLEVIDAGPLTTIQDRGRSGWAHVGVPRAGALDRRAAALANRLVGNGDGAAVLETTGGGVILRTTHAVAVAVTGAPALVRVDGRAVAHGLAVTIPAGSVLMVGPALEGVRSYVAVAGGIAVEPVLGSRSTDTLAWIGPPRLAPGQVLPVGAPAGSRVPVDAVPVERKGLDVITLTRGPRASWLSEEGWGLLDGAAYTVAADSDRVGVRLTGPPLVRSRDGELLSEGIITGAVQLPPSGQPVIFLADHPTTGGYPVVALVEDDDLDRCAQLRPGDVVRTRVR